MRVEDYVSCTGSFAKLNKSLATSLRHPPCRRPGGVKVRQVLAKVRIAKGSVRVRASENSYWGIQRRCCHQLLVAHELAPQHSHAQSHAPHMVCFLASAAYTHTRIISRAHLARFLASAVWRSSRMRNQRPLAQPRHRTQKEVPPPHIQSTPGQHTHVPLSC